MNQKYDIIIIGSGLGGLLSGALLSKYGYSVCVLEKHSVIGGNLQTFNRNGKEFSTGMHYIGSMDKDQILYKIFNFFDVFKNVEFEKLDPKCYDKIIIGKKEFCYSSGINNFKTNLINKFPNNSIDIEKYILLITSIWDENPIINLKHQNIESFYNNKYLNISINDVLSEITENEELKSVLVATNGLYAGLPNITPFYLHALISYFFIQSAYRIKDGSSSLANSFKNFIEKNNGTVLVNKQVVKINVENNEVVSILTKNNELFYAKHYISNIHPSLTNELVTDGFLRKANVSRIKNLPNSIGSFVVYFSLKKECFKHLNYNVYHSRNNDIWAADYCNEDIFPKGYMLYTNEDKLNKNFAESATVITFMKYEDVVKWENTTVNRRGKDYEEFKKNKVESILALIKEYFPDFENCVENYWTSSPLTYRDYTGIPDGSMYGILKDCNNTLNTYIHPKTKISNLLMVGQNVGIHGILGVAINAVFVCSFFVDIKKILNEINSCENDEKF